MAARTLQKSAGDPYFGITPGFLLHRTMELRNMAINNFYLEGYRE